jgi:hypothetical protein
MLPIRSPLGAIGAILVALEGVAGGSLFALDSSSVLQTAMVAAMILVFVAVTVVLLGVIIYFAVRQPAYLFNPSDISESAHLALYGGGASAGRYVQVPPEVEPILITPGALTIDDAF